METLGNLRIPRLFLTLSVCTDSVGFLTSENQALKLKRSSNSTFLFLGSLKDLKFKSELQFNNLANGSRAHYKSLFKPLVLTVHANR